MCRKVWQVGFVIRRTRSLRARGGSGAQKASCVAEAKRIMAEAELIRADVEDPDEAALSQAVFLAVAFATLLLVQRPSTPI
jgi:hypothetical protein